MIPIDTIVSIKSGDEYGGKYTGKLGIIKKFTDDRVGVEFAGLKNHDYGDSFHTTFVEEGLAMARIRLGDKFSRFKTLSRLSCNDRDQQQVTDESIRDTLLDLANYAIMTVLEMDTPDESHATLYAYDKPIYTVGGG